jgi:dihydroorotate dehydrogenase
LPDDGALINRLGFNNDGAVVITERLKKLKYDCIVGVNIGKNKDVPNEEATENYLKSFDRVHPVADYIAVNVSSPNTPNLRDLQKAESLNELLGALQQRNSSSGTLNGKPLLVKIAPDLIEAEIEMIVGVCLRHGVSGIIATNTTVSRDRLTTQNLEKIGAGGVSGRPLTKLSTEVISTICRHSRGKLPIIGVGGIFTAEEAFTKIAAGASLIQAYTGFVYGGPSFARNINEGLAQIIRERGFGTLDEAVGSAISQ